MIYLGDRKISINGFANIPVNGWVGRYDKSLVISEENWPKLNEIIDEIDLSDYGITGDYEYKVGYLIGRQSASTVIYTVANEVYLFSDGTSLVGTGNNNVTHTWADSSPDQGFPDRWVIVCSHEQWCKGYPILTYCYWATGGKAYKQNQAAVNVANRVGYRQGNTPFREMRFLKHIENLKLLVGAAAEYAFRITDSLEDIANCTWDTNGCKSFAQFFYGCSKLKSISMAGFDTSSNLNCNQMFYNCISLVSIDLSTWDMSNCTNCSNMFTNCTSLTTIDTSTWNLASCTNCSNMFTSCTSLTTIDTSTWNLASCTNCSVMFSQCSSLKSLNTSAWNLALCSSCVQMFNSCMSLTTIDMTNWSLASCTRCDQMFWNCYSLQSIGNTSNLNTGNITTFQWFLAGCSTLNNIDISNFDFSKTTNMQEILTNNPVITTLCPNGWTAPMDFSSCTSFTRWFSGLSNLEDMPPFTNIKPNMDIVLNGSPLSKNCVAQFNQAGNAIVGGIIYYLNDLTGQTKSTLRLSATTKGYFTAEERSLIESTVAAKNWTLAW